MTYFYVRLECRICSICEVTLESSGSLSNLNLVCLNSNVERISCMIREVSIAEYSIWTSPCVGVVFVSCIRIAIKTDWCWDIFCGFIIFFYITEADHSSEFIYCEFIICIVIGGDKFSSFWVVVEESSFGEWIFTTLPNIY